MLTTNMIRKDLNSQNQYDAGAALSGLACFINPDLARDLANDIMTLVCTITMKFYKIGRVTVIKIFALNVVAVFYKTLYTKEGCSIDVQSLSLVPRCSTTSLSSPQREAGGPRPR
jgi:Adaptin N terminal region